jgi:NTE family protein
MKRALVLCGGGSLGSYEVGVWKYLREKQMHFDIVTGTSIGSINGAMVVMDDFEKAEIFGKDGG